MAISPIEFAFLRAAFLNGCLPRGGHILEFGAANVTGLNVVAALQSLDPQAPGIDALVKEAERLEAEAAVSREFAQARLIYKAIFNHEAYTAIDLADEPHHAESVRQDLNEPFNLGRRFDVCINNGTSEHIFNQASFYRAVHDHTRTGGVMVHWTPGLGWLNHGFYNVQPGFFVDVARDNGYDIRLACFATAQNLYPLTDQIDEAIWQKYPDLREALVCVVLQKTSDAPFRLPVQGMYQKLRHAAAATR